MKTNFKQFIELSIHIESHGSICLYENWAKNISKSLPNLQLDLPTIEIKSTIETILRNKNPIYIKLKNGTTLLFTYAEFKRIDGIPEVGKTMTVKMQRLPEDKSAFGSKIISCQVT